MADGPGTGVSVGDADGEDGVLPASKGIKWNVRLRVPIWKTGPEMQPFAASATYPHANAVSLHGSTPTDIERPYGVS